CAALADEAEGCEQLAIGMRARVIGLHHQTRAGTPGKIDIDALAALLRERQPADTYLAEAWWIVAQAFDALDRPQDAEGALRHAFEWVIGRALPNVPPAFRDSFLHRNAANLSLLAGAAKRLGLRPPAAAITPG
ncbi:MAG TPA: hypothetical protein VFF72_06185, partial [Caldimonas sp.]|nr:hypothetical protein [Caldimonas sp.]